VRLLIIFHGETGKDKPVLNVTLRVEVGPRAELCPLGVKLSPMCEDSLFAPSVVKIEESVHPLGQISPLVLIKSGLSPFPVTSPLSPRGDVIPYSGNDSLFAPSLF
jgi:hypothetical protein